MRRRAADQALDRGLTALLLLGFYYNAYRYPLQINDSGTSPTYSDTPAWLSFGKYVLVALAMLFLVLVRIGRREPIRIHKPFHAIGYLLLALLPMVSGVMAGQPGFLAVGVFFLLPVLLQTFHGWRVSFARLNRVLAATVWVAVIVEVIQLLLFATIQRLPALAYAKSISVRFGSFLDDPNGFGLLISWLAPFALVYFTGWRRVVSVGLLMVSLLATQSLTAVGAFLATGAVLTALYVSEHPRLLFPVLSVSLLGVLAVGAVLFTFRREIQLGYELYMFTKQGSIAGHAKALTVFGDMGLLNLLGVQPLVERWVETGYVNLLLYFGVVYLLVYLLLGGSAMVRYARLFKSRDASPDARAFAFGALGLLGAVYLGNLNLPVISIYPLDLFAALLLGMASAGLAAEPAEATPPAGPAGADAGAVVLSAPAHG